METMTKEQKRYYAKWTVIMGLVCGLAAAGILLLIGKGDITDSVFWFQVCIVAGGGGYALGFLPSIILDFRRGKEDDHGSV